MSEDASDEPPKRKKKQMRVVSDSESDDDGQPNQHNPRKHLRVSDEESSDSSVGCSRRTLPALSDWSDDTGDEEQDAGSPGGASDSSDGNSDKCPICLARLAGQTVGIPESCEHVFCAECITEWSRNVNTCPVDRLSFKSIVVRACVGGRVLQSRPVNSSGQLQSDDVFENDVTTCQVCNSGDDEATLLLCDSCDGGFHMRCLSPPLDEIPEGEWYCPSCAPRWSDIALSNALVERVQRHLGGLARAGGARSSRSRPAPRPRRSAPRRRRTRAAVTEYEIRDGGKFPVKRAVKKKKRKVKRSRARTAARRAAVRATVRDRLAAFAGRPVGSAAPISAPTLSLFGNHDELEYFSGDEDEMSGGGVAVTARRPTASILSEYRRARRKMITIPSPPRASTAPDLLSDIMESQTLLHSKRSLFSIAVDGKVNIKLQSSGNTNKPNNTLPNKDERVNLPSADELAKKAPSYPGNSSGGNWSGDHRGGYNDNQGNYRNNGSRNSYGDGHQGHGGLNNQNNSNYSYQLHQNNSNMWSNSPNSYQDRRPNDYVDDDYRNRRNFPRPNLPPQFNRGPNFARSFSEQNEDNLGSHRLAFPIITPRRNTFGGFTQDSDALDMRVAHEPTGINVESAAPDLYADIAPPRQLTPPPSFEPLPEPPVFRFVLPIGPERSEDEKSDSGLMIDTEKYDPTEPTNDESGDEDKFNENVVNPPPLFPSSAVMGTQISFEQTPSRPIPISPSNRQSALLDKAVQQVISEHRNRIGSSPVKHNIAGYKSDEDSEGDCPNFSIYSATSVNIANSSETMLSGPVNKPENEYLEKEEDLVQEDDDIPLPEEPQSKPDSSKSENQQRDEEIVLSAQEKAAKDQYEERISRKCPITTNKRNPIKIKLQTTQSLIKRNVSLYEEDEIDKETEKECEVPNDNAEKSDTENRHSVPIEKDSPKKVESSKNDFECASEEKEKYYPEKENSIDDTESSKVISEKNIENKDESTENIENKDELTENISEDENVSEKQSVNDNEHSPKKSHALDKMTESISESEDERSFTPCLDENKSKDTSLENEKENLGLEGLETEMISEEEGNEMFSDAEDSPTSLHRQPEPGEEEGEIIDKMKELQGKESDESDEKDGKKKKRKEKKGMSKDKSKSKSKKSDVAFKKLSKSNKERNYRDKDDKNKIKTRDKKKSDGKENKEKQRDKKKEKRKDIERYDVRSVVSDKKKRVKDAFGRDTSRPRTMSPSAPPSLSPARRSLSRAQSISNDRYTPSIDNRFVRRSFSRDKTSRSKSPLMRKSVSPRNRHASPIISPKKLSALRRSKSRERRLLSPAAVRRSISPRLRRSFSPRLRRSISPRLRRSLSRGRRSISHRRRNSPSPRARRKIRRSVSPRRRSASPHHRRSWSRAHKRARSKTPKRKSKSPRKKTRRSRSRVKSLSKLRSRSPKPKKSRRTKTRRSPRRKSPKAKKRLSRSLTPELLLSPARNPPMWRGEKAIYREWSRSRSINSRLMSPSWTPLREQSIENENLRVYLDNNDKTKRKEKRRRREVEKTTRRAPDIGPSKEVFTSGNNILVSVSFNKDELQNRDSGGELGTRKRKRKTEGKKDKRIKRKRTEKKKDLENKKPVAIIDLEKSPFRELTPSPKNIIVLSDSDQGEKEDDCNDRPIANRPELRDTVPSIPERVNPVRENFSTVGPKTPPEPSIKFTIASKTTTQLRAANPLHEDEPDEVREENQHEEKAKEGPQKGPNTPPDPPNTPPSSPDAYDPFEPTKSGSATPEPQPAQENTEHHERKMITLETAQKTNLSADDVVAQRPITPIEKVMALLQSTRNVSPTAVEDEPCTERGPEPEANATGAPATNSPDATANPPVYHSLGIPRIGVYNSSPRNNIASQATNQRIVLPSPSKSSPLKTQPTKLFLAKPSPIKSTPIKPMPAKTLLKLPLPSVKPLLGRRDMDLSDSPYSPGSSDFGDLFEPPSDGGKTYGKSGSNDVFDTLFNSKPRKNKSSTRIPVKQIKHKGKTQVGVKLDENSLKILDDLPSSAVEMQVKSKFLKKLNRQERVVEEVKLVLKPHYNKKHVTKEQYKDILRKAVPKICHNKTGEINPAKIQSLVEAYVKKCRIKSKMNPA